MDNWRSLTGGLLGLFLLLGMVSPLAFTSCVTPQPEIKVTLEMDYGKIIQAINATNSSLTEKLSLIETALKNGFDENNTQQALLKQAVESLGGTMEEKLAAVETAVKAQTTSLETKLGLIQASVDAGFVDTQAQQVLLKQAIESLGGTMEEKLAAVETAIKSQTTSLETKIALVETAVKEGFADTKTQQGLLKQAVESLGGTMEEKLAAIETAIKSQTTDLGAKLALVETAVKEGFADTKTQQGLLKQAIESLGGTMEEKLAAIETAIKSQTTDLGAKLALVETAVKEGLADTKTQQGLLKQAIESLEGTQAEKLAKIEQAIASQTTDLTTKLSAIETAVASGAADETAALALLQTAVEAIPASLTSLDTDLSAKIAEVVTAIAAVNTNLTTGDVATALSNILDAISNQTDYSAILTAINEAVEAIEINPPQPPDPPVGSPKDLTVWCYPNATFDLDLSKAVEVSDIYCALHASEDGSCTADYIENVEFQPLNDSIAPVQVTFDKDRHFICFHPDTAGSRVWRNFQDSSGFKNEGVTGRLILTDRWNTKDTIFNMVTPRGEKLFKISWFNASGFSWRKKVSMSMIEDNRVTLVLDEFSRVLGFDYDKLKKSQYMIQQEYQKLEPLKILACDFKPEETALELEFKDDYQAGSSYGLIGIITVLVQPDEMSYAFSPVQMKFRFDLTVEITGN